MKELFQPNKDQLNLTTILCALGDPIRLNIVKQLSDMGEITCSGVGSVLPRPALSHHFKVLRESGIIHVRIEGKQRFLSIRYNDLEKRFPGLLETILKCV
ncbi:MAG: helix-turn-helix transcriptional regulator [Hungatella sp.]|nr:helix-turn-helix transcriptional regulator [Hungatella sp.]